MIDVPRTRDDHQRAPPACGRPIKGTANFLVNSSTGTGTMEQACAAVDSPEFPSIDPKPVHNPLIDAVFGFDLLNVARVVKIVEQGEPAYLYDAMKLLADVKNVFVSVRVIDKGKPKLSLRCRKIPNSSSGVVLEKMSPLASLQVVQ
jgi:hypothetical protein